MTSGTKTIGLQPVNDPALLAQLNAPDQDAGLMPVSDPQLLAQLNAQEPPAPPMSGGQEWTEAAKNVGSAIARPIAKGLAALPLMAMDAGVAARNLGGYALDKMQGKTPEPFYEMPSTMFNKALDTYTRPPEGLGKGAEFVSSVLAGSRAPSPQAAVQAPANYVRPASSIAQETFRQGQQAGYVAPPSTVNPTLGNQLAEGAAGKLSVAQAASVRNQDVTNQLARRALGLADDAPLTIDTLKGVRAQAGKIYEQVAKSGEIRPDGQYLDELAQLGKSADDIAKDFPDAEVAASDKIGKLVDSLLRDKFDARSALEYLKELRAQASSNLSFQSAADPAKRALGMAQKEAAATLEDLITRHLAANGDEALATAFDGARKTIAKTYSVQSALNESTGNVVASALGGQLKRGKPLSAELELAARFARTFPKATKEVTESFPGVSPWDFGFGGLGSFATGTPLPFAYPLIRMGLRYGMLMPGAQRTAAGLGGYGGLPPGAVMGSLAAPEAAR